MGRHKAERSAASLWHASGEAAPLRRRGQSPEQAGGPSGAAGGRMGCEPGTCATMPLDLLLVELPLHLLWPY